MAVNKFTISVQELIGSNSCSSPKLDWEDPSCGSISCKIDNGHQIEVTIPEDCPNECFKLIYSCEDNCVDCEPIVLNICPCEENSDCKSCETCDGNLCVSKCDEGEFCDDTETCVECNEDFPCPDGQQCVGGVCECPPSKPYKNSKGECVPCLEGTCPTGTVCTKDGCEPVDCEDGVYNVVKEKCVQCNNTGDCKNPNECCSDNNDCNCCPGFIRDYTTGLCIEEPDCDEDSDCPECMVCTSEGCVDIVCPPGKVCVPGEGCVEECDCANPGCSNPGAACSPLPNGRCYCHACSGGCDDSTDCGPDCYCNGSNQCAPNNCSGKCSDGTDCGPNCGCNDDGDCVPCDSVNCATDPENCSKILGCGCNGGNCEKKNDCEEKDCSNSFDCGQDCTCDEAVCQDCANYSCADCASRPGCKCTDGVHCEGDPDYTCKDKLEGKLNDNCTAEVTQTLAEGCACPKLTLNTKIVTVLVDPGGPTTGPESLPSNKYYPLRVHVQLRKGMAASYGEAISNPLLNNTSNPIIADNDTPVSGTITALKEVYVQRYTYINNVKVADGGIVIDGDQTKTINLSVAGLAEAKFTSADMNFSPYGTYIDDAQLVQVMRTVYTFSQKSVLAFANDCDYKQLVKIGGFTINQANSALFVKISNNLQAAPSSLESFKVISSSDKRLPLIKWYKSADNSYDEADVMRKLYLPLSSGKYFDKLFGPGRINPKGKYPLSGTEGELWGNRYYAVETDCGCGDKFKDLGKAVFCNPTDFKYVMSECNSVITLQSPFVPCAVNQDINQWGYQIDADARTKYDLYLNNKKVATFVHKAGTGMVVEGSNNTMFANFKANLTQFEQITSAVIKINYDSEEKCNITKNIAPVSKPTIPYTTNCTSIPGKVIYTFNKALYNITSITGITNNVVINQAAGTVTADSGDAISILLKLASGCDVEFDLEYNCCDTLTLVNATTNIVTTTDVILKSTVTGGKAPYNVTYTSGFIQLGASTNAADNFPVTLILSPGQTMQIKATVTDANDCSKTINYQVTKLETEGGGGENDYIITAKLQESSCAYTGKVCLTIPNDASLVGGVIHYYKNGGIQQSLTILANMIGTDVCIEVGASGTFKLYDVVVGGESFLLSDTLITIPANLNDGKPKVTSLLANGGTATVSICQGDDVELTVVGTANAIVEFNSGLTQIFLDGSGNGSTIVSPLTNTTYTITKITNFDGTCQGVTGLNLQRIVAVGIPAPITVVSDVCNGLLTQRTIQFSAISTAKDQAGNNLTITSNAVTVDPNSVTAVTVTYVNGSCTSTLTHDVNPCDCPTIVGTYTGSGAICAGSPVTLTAGATGGAAPYTYQFFIDGVADGPPTATAARAYAPAISTVYSVVATDSNGCDSALVTKAVTVNDLPDVNIVPNTGQYGVVEDAPNHFNVCDNQVTVLFKTDAAYAGYSWNISGAYGGSPTSGTSSIIRVTVADISGAAFINLTVTAANGCTSFESVQLTKVTCEILTDDEILYSTPTNALYKAEITASTVGASTLVCSSLPAPNIALRPNGDLLVGSSINLFKANLDDCSNAFIAAFNSGNSLGMLTTDIVVAFQGLPAKNKLVSYNVQSNTANLAYYTIADGTYDYASTGDIVRVGSYLYALANKYLKADNSFIGFHLVRFTLVSNAVTVFLDMGAFPNIGAPSPFGIVSLSTGVYTIYSNGDVYDTDVTNAALSTYVGSLGTNISDATNNL